MQNTELMIEGMGCVGYFADMDKETIETTFGPLDGKTYPAGHKEPPKGFVDKGLCGMADIYGLWTDGERSGYVDKNGLKIPTSPPAMPRQGDFMQVFPARKFWPMDPRVNEVTLEAIATSLAHQCRYAGHMSVDLHYSVAEHSVHIARWILKETGNVEWALCGLMHDASEAYLVDVPRPVKGSLPQYRAIESKVMTVICERFKLPLRMPDIVKEADDRIIADEVHAIMEPMEWHGQHDDKLGVAIKCWERREAREEFLATFWALNGGRE